MADQAPVARSTAMDLAQVVSIAPVRLTAPQRGEDIQLRVSAPVDGDRLPVLIFSHGNGQSHHAYGPIVHYWAAQGFAVISPTHLDSRMLALPQDDPRRPDLWHHREQDLVRILDELDAIADQIPAIHGRLDRDRIAVAGHSWGAQTASMLLGATHPDPRDGTTVGIADDRVKAGVLLAVPGTGGRNLSEFAATRFPFMNPSFARMDTPALIVAGDADHGAMTTRGPDWWREAYDLSPGRKALFTVFGGEHSLGGVANYEAKETTDESPLRIAAVQRVTTAYLRHVLGLGDAEWRTVSSDVASEGRIDTK
ncbi:chlorophyllase [Roseomonas sp. OT10]|uniref:alpha/beta hydrolase family protein n=1 Tax=Roseomonas cutis TaxID=2897332 RepID=UPI001E5DE102|nr:alpha/beta fold hydrolase [Roseomonas sp. OT10]UFN48926.1 chlorophyllase [Roseomonas sp. OT10]